MPWHSSERMDYLPTSGPSGNQVAEQGPGAFWVAPNVEHTNSSSAHEAQSWTRNRDRAYQQYSLHKYGNGWALASARRCWLDIRSDANRLNIACWRISPDIAPEHAQAEDFVTRYYNTANTTFRKPGRECARTAATLGRLTARVRDNKGRFYSIGTHSDILARWGSLIKTLKIDIISAVKVSGRYLHTPHVGAE